MKVGEKIRVFYYLPNSVPISPWCTESMGLENNLVATEAQKYWVMCTCLPIQCIRTSPKTSGQIQIMTDRTFQKGYKYICSRFGQSLPTLVSFWCHGCAATAVSQGTSSASEVNL